MGPIRQKCITLMQNYTLRRNGNTAKLSIENVDQTLASFVRIANNENGLADIGFLSEKKENNRMPKFCCFIDVYSEVFCFHSATSALISEMLTSYLGLSSKHFLINSEITRVAEMGSAVFVLTNSWGSSIADAHWRVSSVRYDEKQQKFIDSERIMTPFNLTPCTSSRPVIGVSKKQSLIDEELTTFKSKFHGSSIDISSKVGTKGQTPTPAIAVDPEKEAVTVKQLLVATRSQVYHLSAELEQERADRQKVIDEAKAELTKKHHADIEKLVGDCEEADKSRDAAMMEHKQLTDTIERFKVDASNTMATRELQTQFSEVSARVLLVEEELIKAKQCADIAQKTLMTARKQLRDMETRRDAAESDVHQLRDELETTKERLSVSKKEAAEKLAECLELKQRMMSSSAAYRRLLQKNQDIGDTTSKTAAFRLLYMEAARRRACVQRRKLQQTTRLFDGERKDYKTTIDALEQTCVGLRQENDILRDTSKVAAGKWETREQSLTNDLEASRNELNELQITLDKMRNDSTGKGDVGGTGEACTSEKNDKGDKEAVKDVPEKGGGAGVYPAQAVSSANACIAQLKRFVDEVSGGGRDSPSSSTASPPTSMQPTHQNHVYGGAPPAMMMYPPTFYHPNHQPPMVFYGPNEVGSWS